MSRLHWVTKKDSSIVTDCCDKISMEKGAGTEEYKPLLHDDMPECILSHLISVFI